MTNTNSNWAMWLGNQACQPNEGGSRGLMSNKDIITAAQAQTDMTDKDKFNALVAVGYSVEVAGAAAGIRILPRSQLGCSISGATAAMADEDSTSSPTHRATEVIKDLKAGRVPQSVVRDLGDAVGQATRDSNVGRALGNSRVSGGMSR